MQLCEAAGPAAAAALVPMLDAENLTVGGERARRVLTGYGAAVVNRMAPLLSSPHWYARRNAAQLLAEIRSADAVPLLQPLLRGNDPRVTQAAIQALSSIDDPAAARCLHTALRAAAGEARQAIVSALVAERDPRVVPLLARILDESDAIGQDHGVVLETLGAVAALGGDAALPAVDRVMRKTRWFARPKLRALKTKSVQTLRQIGTPEATAVLSRAVTDGDRLLRRVAGEAGGA
jgi:HEAT repeat protein